MLAPFALVPVGLTSALPLATLGFIAFAEAVWDTSRVRQLADPARRARVQSFYQESYAEFLILWYTVVANGKASHDVFPPRRCPG